MSAATGLHEAPRTSTAPRPGRAGSVLRRSATWGYRLLLVAAVLLAAFATIVPWALQRSGDRLVTITSGSMTPLFPVGSTITIHRTEHPETLEPGQIITFRTLGNGTVVTHRIVRRVVDPGVTGVFFQTQGDANRSPDPDLAPSGNVIGVADGVLPAWELAAVGLQTPKGRLLAYGSLFVVVALGEIAAVLAGVRRRASEGAS